MRRLSVIVLALVFGFLGVIALSYMPKELIADSQVIMESPDEVISMESTENNGVEVNGVRFEILVPERVWTIPPNQPGAETPVKIGIRITNTKEESVRFYVIDPISRVVTLDGVELRRSGGRDLLLHNSQLICRLLTPEESLTFFPDVKLFWRDNKLYLEGFDRVPGGLNDKEIHPGTYLVGLIYNSVSSAALCPYPGAIDPKTAAPELTEGLWTGEVITPLVEVQLVQP